MSENDNYDNMDDLVSRLREEIEKQDGRDMNRYPEKNTGCNNCQFRDSCYDAFMNHAVYCGEYLTVEIVKE